MRTPPISPRNALASALLGALLAAAFAAAADVPSFVGDDGGITLRYAERIAEGRGFGYNDGERVNGSSNPLYTLLLAAALRAGVAPASAVVAIGVASVAVAAGALVFAFARRGSLAAAALAWLALVVSPFRTGLLFSGLESPLTLALACLAVAACGTSSAAFRGLAVGALVANKLDGAAAALALAASVAVCERRLALREAAWALAAYLPVAALQLAAFGSVLPNSAATKLAEHANAAFDRGWVVDGLLDHGAWQVVPAALAVLLQLHPRARSRAGVFASVWLVLHVAVFSLVDLGAPYPWYLLAPTALLAPLAAIALLDGVALAAAAASLGARAAELARATLVVLAAVVWVRPLAEYQLAPSTPRTHLAPYAESDLARQAAGAWLRKHTSATELLASPWGLPAYEYGGPVYDGTFLNSRPDEARFHAAMYYLGEFPSGAPSREALGAELVAFFRCGPRSVGYAVYARPASEVARARIAYLDAPRDGLARDADLRATDFKAVDARTAARIEGDVAGTDGYPACRAPRDGEPDAHSP
ncbi:MAG: hypothetical protein R3E88_04125 [Myxococcota bacterium]